MDSLAKIKQRICKEFFIRAEQYRARALVEAFQDQVDPDVLEAFLFEQENDHLNGEKIMYFGVQDDYRFRVVRESVDKILAKELSHG